MIHPYEGTYGYSDAVVRGWNSNAIGVYYCGYVTADNNLSVLYIGKGAGTGGMQERLLYHLQSENWPDVSCFGYCRCDTVSEAKNWETEEIARYRPKYNEQGK